MTPIDLRQGIHLKHQNLISLLLKKLKSEGRTDGRADGRAGSYALDGLPGADRWGDIEAKLTNSFQKHELQTKDVFDPTTNRRIYLEPYFAILATPIDIQKTCPIQRHPQNCPNLLKTNSKVNTLI